MWRRSPACRLHQRHSMRPAGRACCRAPIHARSGGGLVFPSDANPRSRQAPHGHIDHAAARHAIRVPVPTDQRHDRPGSARGAIDAGRKSPDSSRDACTGRFLPQSVTTALVIHSAVWCIWVKDRLTMHRRRFLFASTSLAIAHALRTVHSAGPARTERDNLRDLLGRLFPAADSTGPGRAYLVAMPEEADLQALLAQVPRMNDGDSWSRAIALKIDDDFVKRDIVYLDGWLFSRTEARLCAISCLI